MSPLSIDLSGHLLWLANRGTGIVLLVLYTLVVVLAAHIATAVIDTYVDIRWFDAFLPVGGLYRPLYLGLGALSLDLLVAVGLTSAVRSRISERVWRRIHWLAYPSWAVAVVHSVGIGTDMASPWGLWTVLACVAAVLSAVAGRAVTRRVQVAG